MTKRLYEVLKSRHAARDESKPWVFAPVLEREGKAVG
jgi:hypothetical protein